MVNGGLIYAARGPLSAGFIRENGAPGAITFQLDLGRAMLKASGADRVRATVDFLGGELLVDGEVVENTVTYGGGFDLGRMTVRGAQGEAVLGVYNEFMTAEAGGKRVATFPDMIGTLDPATGDVCLDFGVEAGRANRGCDRASLEISGRQGRARPGGVSGGRAGDGRRPALISLKERIAFAFVRQSLEKLDDWLASAKGWWMSAIPPPTSGRSRYVSTARAATTWIVFRPYAWLARVKAQPG